MSGPFPIRRVDRSSARAVEPHEARLNPIVSEVENADGRIQELASQTSEEGRLP